MSRTTTKAYYFFIDCQNKKLIPLNVRYTDFLDMLKEMLNEVKND